LYNLKYTKINYIPLFERNCGLLRARLPDASFIAFWYGVSGLSEFLPYIIALFIISSTASLLSISYQKKRKYLNVTE